MHGGDVLCEVEPVERRRPQGGLAAVGRRGSALPGTSESCVATPSSDVAVVFAALEGSVQLLSPNGGRTGAFAGFLLLPGSTPNREQALRCLARFAPRGPRPANSPGNNGPHLPNEATTQPSSGTA